MGKNEALGYGYYLGLLSTVGLGFVLPFLMTIWLGYLAEAWFGLAVSFRPAYVGLGCLVGGVNVFFILTRRFR